MKNLILIFLVIWPFFAIGQTNEEFVQKGTIINQHQKGLKAFSKVANIIDSDTESFWAYEQADSLLTTIKIDGNYYYQNLSKIYSAYTYLFYGMSYTKTIIAISRGDNYSLEELNATIIPYENKDLSKYELAKKELGSIYSAVNFYKVSRMQKYDKMNSLFEEYSNMTEELFKQLLENEAYEIVSLKNKKLYFMTFVNLIIDIYLFNNQNTNDELKKVYFNNLTKIAASFDKVPDDYDQVSKINNNAYFEYVNVCSKSQEEMLQLLTDEIKILAKSQNN